MAIRIMTIDDYEQLVSLWEAAPGVGLHDYEDSQAGLTQYLARNPGLSLVYREGNVLAGTVLCGHDGRRGYLHHLAVAPAYRGRGIGSKLIEQALKNLAQEGIRKCNLFSFHDNQAGLAFWQKLGWKQRDDVIILSRQISLPSEHFIRVQIR
jgi:N-acetylglutamate synthase